MGTDALNLLLMMLKYSMSLAPKEAQSTEEGSVPHSLDAYQRLAALRQRFRQHAALAQLLRDVHGGKDL